MEYTRGNVPHKGTPRITSGCQARSAQGTRARTASEASAASGRDRPQPLRASPLHCRRLHRSQRCRARRRGRPCHPIRSRAHSAHHLQLTHPKHCASWHRGCCCRCQRHQRCCRRRCWIAWSLKKAVGGPAAPIVCLQCRSRSPWCCNRPGPAWDCRGSTVVGADSTFACATARCPSHAISFVTKLYLLAVPWLLHVQRY